MYTIELTDNDNLIINTAVQSAVRLIQARETEREAIKFTTAAAEVITRRNEARLDATDVKFLCACLSKLHLGAEGELREAVRLRCGEIINKLVGVGAARHTLRAGNSNIETREDSNGISNSLSTMRKA